MVIDLLTDDLRAAMLAHAQREAPRESCGLVVRSADGTVQYLAANNVHAGPAGEDAFRIDPAFLVMAEELGDTLAIVHSHPNASANPSMADRLGCERSMLPWIIVGWPHGVIKQIWPEGWKAPMEGRDFHFGVLDCYTLIQDWYARELNIQLPDFERTFGFWDRGEDLYGEGFPKAGFVEVQGEPQLHDVLLMKLMRSPVAQHGAVYIGDGQMLHHLIDQPSCKAVWDGPWRARTTAVLRHRSLL